MFQGEELGLPESELTLDQLQDPYGITFWPTFKGRDGCRTPMPWQADEKNAGFSTGKPWLPVSESHLPLSVSLQEKQAQSPLNHYRRFMAWRKEQTALIDGEIEFIDAPEGVLAFYRKNAQQTLLVVFNLTDSQTEMACKGQLLDTESPTSMLTANLLTLSPFGSAFIEC